MKRLYNTEFIFIDDEYRIGLRMGSKTTLSDIKDQFQIKGRLYIKEKYNCGARTYKLVGSDYQFTLYPI
jgi:hypothetical protein